jgi:2-C-methyl-D-erythritol 4-phosphate cytidylyltransferase
MTAAEAPQPRDVTVLVPAAGGGERLGLGPKALLPLHGRPVAEWVVRKAMQIDDEVIVACPPGSQPVFDADCRWRRIDGGPTRQQSVRLLARAATRPWVVVWDAARPFTSIMLARAVLAAAGPAGAAAAMLPDGSFQTPLAFGREVLLGVAEQAQQGAWVGTSTMELVLRAGLPFASVPGDVRNIKLTTSHDWALAQTLQQQLA